MTFDEALAQVANDPLTVVIVPLFVLAMVIEASFSRWRKLDLYQGKDFGVSMAMLIFASLVDAIPKVLAFMAFFVLHEMSPLRDVIERQWWAWVLLFFFSTTSSTTGSTVLIMKCACCGLGMWRTIHRRN